MKAAPLAGMLALLALAAPANARTRDECVGASTRAQELRDAHALVAARRELAICADPSCPAIVRKDCSAWLEEVERDVPSLSITARDERGAALPGARVLVDGVAVDDPLAPILVDPGPHVVRVEAPGRLADERRVTATTGVKAAPVVVTLAATAVLGPPPPHGATASGSAWTTAGWVVLGTGAGGLLLGGIFGGLAIASKSAAACDATFACDPEPLARSRSQALVSTIGFVAGAVLVGSGVALVLVGASRGSTRSVALAPNVAAPGLALTGSF